MDRRSPIDSLGRTRSRLVAKAKPVTQFNDDQHLPIHLLSWIEANLDSFAGPVSNRVVWPDADLIFMVIKGPNARTDFHIDPGDEIFMQLSGTIRVDLRTEQGVETRMLHQGEIMRVPAHVPHSPMRPAGSVGVVIERRRGPDEMDHLDWYCDVCDNRLHRATFNLADIETDLIAALRSFNSDEALRTCDVCGTVKAEPTVFQLPPPGSGEVVDG